MTTALLVLVAWLGLALVFGGLMSMAVTAIKRSP